MRSRTLAFALLLLAGACKEKAPIVNITTVPPTENTVSFNTAYEVEEGANLDLVIDTGAGTSTVTTTTLPTNAKLENGIFSFAPDYTQAGLYSVVFTITSGTTQTSKTIALRVKNVIHPSAQDVHVKEGTIQEIAMTSNDPAGTIVSYSADVSAIPGATFEALTGKITFSPDIAWLDTLPSQFPIIVNATGQEIDGTARSSTGVVMVTVDEATSFSQEIVPLFKNPGPADATNSPQGHKCLTCHTGTRSDQLPEVMDLHSDQAYANLVNVDPFQGSANMCSVLATNGVKRVLPGDPAKSLLYMKVSGTDGSTMAAPPCGAQMPNGIQEYWWTVTNLKAFYQCDTASDPAQCRKDLTCADSDLACKTNAPLVHKLFVWIKDGAPKN